MAALLLSPTSWAKSVELASADGIQLIAEDTGRSEKAILLLHGRDRSAADWSLFTAKLNSKGFRVLALNLRGHGGSAKPATQDDTQFPAMAKDVSAAIAHLKRSRAKSIVVIGADIGANLALQAAIDETLVQSVVLLSPGLNIKGIKTASNISAYGERPVLLAASNGDAYSARTVKFLDTKATGHKRTMLLSGSTSGVDMLTANATLEDAILGWLDGNYEKSAAEASQEALSTGDVSELEAQGKSFGEK